MKKRAYILTFHFVTNYGAFLQCFALSKILKKYYDEVIVIDYRPSRMLDGEKLINTYCFKSIIDSFFSLLSFLSRKFNFYKARHIYLEQTDTCFFNSDFLKLKDGDIYIGSDQVWNFDITDRDMTFLGNFINHNFNNVFSYAASIGYSSISKSDLKLIGKYINNFDKISVRENDAKIIISSIYKDKIDIVLDPTLLFTMNDWIQFFDLHYKKRSNYILLYSLTSDSKVINIAKKLSLKYNMPIIEVAGQRRSLKRIRSHKVYYNFGPKKFLELLLGASFVVTDSFHATVFSILFEKNFLTTKHKTRGSRLEVLLSNLNLLNRYIDDFDDSLLSSNIDYKDVSERLDLFRLKSIKYIEECVNYEKDS